MTFEEPISMVIIPQTRLQNGNMNDAFASASENQGDEHEQYEQQLKLKLNLKLKLENVSEHLNFFLSDKAESSNGFGDQTSEITFNNNGGTILPEVQLPTSLPLSLNIPKPQQKTAQSTETSETGTDNSTNKKITSNDGTCKDPAALQNGACNEVKGKCEPDEHKAFAFCWYKNNVDIFLVLYNKKTILGYKQAAVNW